MESIETALKWHPQEVRFLLVGEAWMNAELHHRVCESAHRLILEDFTPRGTSPLTRTSARAPSARAGHRDGGRSATHRARRKQIPARGRGAHLVHAAAAAQGAAAAGDRGLARHFARTWRAPFRELPEVFKDALFNGTARWRADRWKIDSNKRAWPSRSRMLPQLTRFMGSPQRESAASLARFMNALTCPVCEGKRLRPEVLP